MGVIMLKIIYFTLLIISTSLYSLAADFVHPLDFKGTDPEKELVIKYIKESVKDTYSAIGMDDPATLRMMEQEELNSFKQLTRAENRTILDRVIQTYCGIGMCNYNTIMMMYNEQLKASQETLEW